MGFFVLVRDLCGFLGAPQKRGNDDLKAAIPAFVYYVVDIEQCK